uniref:Uncharacterized protein n=1 Tax=Glossina palpalis gambiensis TaxID=67801 RepID=A0A1B0BYU1_9MUSC
MTVARTCTNAFRLFDCGYMFVNLTSCCVYLSQIAPGTNAASMADEEVGLIKSKEFKNCVVMNPPSSATDQQSISERFFGSKK